MEGPSINHRRTISDSDTHFDVQPWFVTEATLSGFVLFKSGSVVSELLDRACRLLKPMF